MRSPSGFWQKQKVLFNFWKVQLKSNYFNCAFQRFCTLWNTVGIQNPNIWNPEAFIILKHSKSGHSGDRFKTTWHPKVVQAIWKLDILSSVCMVFDKMAVIRKKKTRSHSKTGRIRILNAIPQPPTIEHLKSRHVRFSDLHCSLILKFRNVNSILNFEFIIKLFSGK